LFAKKAGTKGKFRVSDSACFYVGRSNIGVP
jgi:hypothetical protein